MGFTEFWTRGECRIHAVLDNFGFQDLRFHKIRIQGNRNSRSETRDEFWIQGRGSRSLGFKETWIHAVWDSRKLGYTRITKFGKLGFKENEVSSTSGFKDIRIEELRLLRFRETRIQGHRDSQSFGVKERGMYKVWDSGISTRAALFLTFYKRASAPR